MMVLYAISQPKSLIYDNIFDNSFTSQHRFYYSELNNNEEDDMLDLNMIENIDNNVGNDDDEIISHVPKFEHASKSTLVREHLFGSFKESFEKLPRYFWSIRVSIEGFKSRGPLISIDGSYLYGQYIRKTKRKTSNYVIIVVTNKVNTPIKLGIIKTIRCAIILNDKTYICDKYQTFQHPYSHSCISIYDMSFYPLLNELECNDYTGAQVETNSCGWKLERG
uniref:Uncharacterized protein n=1 Tax=Salix viminalis TaxID=40686 RepID=A0A6N2NGN1_SALVM